MREVELASGTRVRFTYDAFGRRLRKEVVTGAVVGRPRVVEFVWDGDALAADIEADRGARCFVHMPGTQIPVFQAERGEVFTYVNDHVGLPKELIDQAGRVVWSAAHSAWGQVVETFAGPIGELSRRRRVESPFRLLGQYADEETGLCAARFRYLDPEVGRWLSPDALGLEGGRDVFGWNGSPTAVIDPLGLIALDEPGYSVYGLYRKGEDTPYYVGVTNDIDRRGDDHGQTQRLVPDAQIKGIPGSEQLTYAEARGHEQAYMEHYGTKPNDRKGTSPGNVNNSFRHDRGDERGLAFEQEYIKKKAALGAAKKSCSQQR